MPKVSAPFTDTFIKSLKAAEKPKKYFDGGGCQSAFKNDPQKASKFDPPLVKKYSS